MQIRLQSDSTSGIATTARRGVGRLRHLAVKQPWLQDEVKDGKIKITYIPTATNEADLMTKGMPTARF
eukprot:12986536-Heterocapsa_arctica.AAC.1